MSFSVASLRRRWRVTGLRVWVVLVLLAGMLVSSLGHASSHGIAAVVAAQHDIGISHGHSHDADGPGTVLEDQATHTHHNSADHSHDKADVPPMGSTGPWPTGTVWPPLMHPLPMGRVGFRLDRPPMA